MLYDMRQTKPTLTEQLVRENAGDDPILRYVGQLTEDAAPAMDECLGSIETIFAGGVRALFGVYGDFHWTPKGGNERRSATPGINTALLAGEVITFAYSLLSLLLACRKGNYYLIPLNFTACVGFGMYCTRLGKRGVEPCIRSMPGVEF